jgi:3-dehydroquinate dehydratase-1
MSTRIPALAIGAVRLGDGPRVVLVVNGPAAGLRRIIRQGIDVLEARVDRFPSREPAHVIVTVRALKRLRLPLIGTVRSHAEGGAARLSDRQRIALYEAIAPLVDAMDVELRAGAVRQAVRDLARRRRIPLILSSHDFHRTPTDRALERLLREAKALGADIVKVATQARSAQDVARLFAFTARHRAKRLVTIAMGPKGTLSRLVFPLAGSLLTYTSLSPRDGPLPAAAFLKALRRCHRGVPLLR